MKLKIKSLNKSTKPYTEILVEEIETGNTHTFNTTTDLTQYVKNHTDVELMNFRVEPSFSLLADKNMPKVVTHSKEGNRDYELLLKKIDGLSTQVGLLEKEKLPLTLPELKKIDEKLNYIIQLENENLKATKYSADTILSQLEELGIQTDEQLNELRQKLKFMFKGKTFEGTIKYPKLKDDMNFAQVYYRDNVTMDEKTFKQNVSDNPECNVYDFSTGLIMTSNGQPVRAKGFFKVEYNKENFDVYRKHLDLIAEERERMHNIFDMDVHSKNNDAINERFLKEVSSTTSVYKNGMKALTDIVLSPLLIPVKALKLGAMSVVDSVSATKEYVNTKVRREGRLKFGEMRHDAIFSRPDMTHISKEDLLEINSNLARVLSGEEKVKYHWYTNEEIEDAMEIYFMDLRYFVVNTRAMMVQKAFLNDGTRGTGFIKYLKESHREKKTHSERPYRQYFLNSMAQIPVEHDELLVNFYVEMYLKYKTKTEKPKDNHYYNKTETGIKAQRTKMNCFTNAYFTAKRSLIGAVDSLYPILDDLDYKIVTEEDHQLYNQFLLRVKTCLILQGIKSEEAEYLVQKFIEVNGVYNGVNLDYYEMKTIQHRGRNEKYGHAVM